MSAAIWKIGLAVLLTLAFSFSCRPFIMDRPTPYSHVMRAETPVFHAHVDQLPAQQSQREVRSRLRVSNQLLYEDPLLSMPIGRDARRARNYRHDGATVAFAVRGKGIDPVVGAPTPPSIAGLNAREINSIRVLKMSIAKMTIAVPLLQPHSLPPVMAQVAEFELPEQCTAAAGMGAMDHSSMGHDKHAGNQVTA